MAALLLVYWFAWRPLPQRSGVIEAGVSRPVTVRFDALGEPHIRAESIEDALFVQGYVTAQDRLWQMDALRRSASGELAEIAGPQALNADRESRRMRMRRAAEAAYANLPPQDRAVIAAYARGVNAFLSTHWNKLPVEFTLLGYQPRPWSGVDTMLVALYMFRDLTTTWRNEILKRDLMREGDPQKVAVLFPVRAGTELQPGSNAWVLSGSHTASGKPLLSNDMHLAYSLPGIWYMAQLEAPGLDVAGVSLPGTPGIIVGHNQRIAWGFTNSQFDVQDIYIEKLDQRTGRYVYEGRIEQAKPEVELIRVKGELSQQVNGWLTRHGPLFATESGETLVLRWTAEDPAIFQFPILDLDQAQNWKQFTAALARYPGPAQNVVYADVDGNIGYHLAGKLPKRRGYLGDLPVDGSSGQFDWEGYIPFDELPSAFNPPRGMIVTANQNPFPVNYPYPVNGNFAPPDRSQEIFDRLSARKNWRAEQLLSVETDVYSAGFQFLAAQVVAAYQGRNLHTSSLDAAVALLRGWNGQMNRDLAAPFLIALVYQHVRTAIGENASSQNGSAYQFTLAPAVVDGLLRQRPAGWFTDWNSMLLRAFADAVDEAARIQGRDPKRWQYGRYLSISINNPVTHQVPVLGKYFDIGPVAMSGSSTTIKQTTRELAPSMRMNADTSDWDHSFLNELTGQSGQPFSSHYRDQWNDYYWGRSYRMQFHNVQAKSRLEFRPSSR
ncbi:MAG TPA: penicillin acylase family protein [Bryobacteraceae bacterium]|nr:penicillin acylase family protein [Bryobacteraceae bacterium]